MKTLLKRLLIFSWIALLAACASSVESPEPRHTLPPQHSKTPPATATPPSRLIITPSQVVANLEQEATPMGVSPAPTPLPDPLEFVFPEA
ncbi:MAG: hypothetical protein U9Q82_00225, partial [Chloroflexota bacterium]|nr:hypothetical protein [Chloroflexota bacterium]